MDKPLKPELLITSFEDKHIHEYIDKLNEISHIFGQDQLITLHIDSIGGDAYGFIMLYEHIQTMNNPIATYTSSKAMSAGAFALSMYGKKGLRFASPNATVVIHEIQSMAFGDIKEMESQMADLSELNEKILKLFATAIGLKGAKEVREMIKNNTSGHDLTLNASQAKALGIVDEVARIKMVPVGRFDLLVDVFPGTAKKKKSKKA